MGRSRESQYYADPIRTRATRETRAAIPLVIVRTSRLIASHPHLARPRGMAAPHGPHVAARRPLPRASGKQSEHRRPGKQTSSTRAHHAVPQCRRRAFLSAARCTCTTSGRRACQRRAARERRRAGPRSQVRRVGRASMAQGHLPRVTLWTKCAD
jgi:hypothetical protein